MFLYKAGTIDNSDNITWIPDFSNIPESNIIQCDLSTLTISRDCFDKGAFSFSFDIPSTPHNDNVINELLNNQNSLSSVIFTIHPFEFFTWNGIPILTFSMVVDSLSEGVWSVNLSSNVKSFSDTFGDLKFGDKEFTDLDNSGLGGRCSVPLEIASPAYFPDGYEDLIISYLVGSSAMVPQLRLMDRVPYVPSVVDNEYTRFSEDSLLSQFCLSQSIMDPLKKGLNRTGEIWFGKIVPEGLKVGYGKNRTILTEQYSFIDPDYSFVLASSEFKYEESYTGSDFTATVFSDFTLPVTVNRHGDPFEADSKDYYQRFCESCGQNYKLASRRGRSFVVPVSGWYEVEMDLNTDHASVFQCVQLAKANSDVKYTGLILNKPNTTIDITSWYGAPTHVADTYFVSIPAQADVWDEYSARNFDSFPIYTYEGSTYNFVFDDSDNTDVLFSVGYDSASVSQNYTYEGHPINYVDPLIVCSKVPDFTVTGDVQFADNTHNFTYSKPDYWQTHRVYVSKYAKYAELSTEYYTVYKDSSDNIITYRRYPEGTTSTDPEGVEAADGQRVGALVDNNTFNYTGYCYLEEGTVYEPRVVGGGIKSGSVSRLDSNDSFHIKVKPSWRVPRFKSKVTETIPQETEYVNYGENTLRDYKVSDFLTETIKLFSNGCDFTGTPSSWSDPEYLSCKVQINPKVVFDQSILISQNDYDILKDAGEIDKSKDNYKIVPISTLQGEWQDAVPPAGQSTEFGSAKICSLLPIGSTYKVGETKVKFPTKPCYFFPNLEHDGSYNYKYAIKGAPRYSYQYTIDYTQDPEEITETEPVLIGDRYAKPEVCDIQWFLENNLMLPYYSTKYRFTLIVDNPQDIFMYNIFKYNDEDYVILSYDEAVLSTGYCEVTAVKRYQYGKKEPVYLMPTDVNPDILETVNGEFFQLRG